MCRRCDVDSEEVDNTGELDRALDLLSRLGAMDVHDETGHTGVYMCSWCDGQSENIDAIAHLHDCRLAAFLTRLLRPTSAPPTK